MSAKIYQHTEALQLESGATIDDLNIAYHTYGKMNADQSNVIWAFHAFSANSDVLAWWLGLFGEGCMFDPAKHFIVCANVIGSPYGTTAPESLDFPLYSVRDIVQAHFILAKHLGVHKVKAAIGGSFGGNQALEFTYANEIEVEHLIMIASSSRESAWNIAIHESQRIALQIDPTFGQKDGGKAGLKAARASAMVHYRNFDTYRLTQTDFEPKMDNYKAASYIDYQGGKFVKRFTALSYYYLSKCMDTHDVGRGRGGERKALAQIKNNTLVIGISTDGLIPVSQQKSMADHIPKARYYQIDSEYGHDGFLIETEKITEVIHVYLSEISLEEKANRVVNYRRCWI